MALGREEDYNLEDEAEEEDREIELRAGKPVGVIVEGLVNGLLGRRLKGTPF